MAFRNPGDVLETFNFLENADDSDEEDDEDGDIMEDLSNRTDKQRIKRHKTKVSRLTSAPRFEFFRDTTRNWVVFLFVMRHLLPTDCSETCFSH